MTELTVASGHRGESTALLAPPESPRPVERAADRATSPVRRSGRIHPAWIVTVGCCCLLVRGVTETGLTNDTYWQWATGQWMLAHHHVIHHDVFSFTVPGQPWLDEEWGFQLLLAGLVRSIGPIAFWILPAGTSVGALLASVIRWRALGSSQLRIAVLAVIATASLLLGDAPRPQTVSYCCFGAELLILTLARRNRRWLVTLPPLLLVWANIHGSFLLGLAVVALELVLSLRPLDLRLIAHRPLPVKTTAVTLLVCTIVSAFANPNGPRLFTYALRLSMNTQLGQLIEEWQSPNFHQLLLVVLVFGPIISLVATLILRERQLDAFDLLLWGCLLLATIHAQRFLPYLGLATGGLFAGASASRAGETRPSLLTAPLAVMLGAAIVLGGPHRAPGTPARSGASAEPVAAVRWLGTHPGRVLSTYAWNDYLIHVGIPVFVDGRTDLYFGTGVLNEWIRLDAVTVDPDPLLQRWGVQYVLWPWSTPLTVYLSSDPRWRIVDRTGPAVVFARV